MESTTTRSFGIKLGFAIALIAGIIACAVSLTMIVGLDEAQAASPSINITRASTGKLAMAKDATYNLGAKASKGKLTYKSSKPKVVVVSKKGKLTAKKTGKATITVKIKGTKVSKKVKVTVVKKSKLKKVKKLTASVAKPKLSVGESTKVSVKFSPKSPSNKNVIYKSSAPAVASVTASGSVKAKKAGTAKITVTSCDNKKAKATVSITVKAKSKPSSSSTASIPSNDIVTRAEFAADLCEAMGLDTVEDQAISPYIDIDSTAQAGAIRALWVEGSFDHEDEDEEMYFDPDEEATRSFAALSAVRVLGYEDDDSDLECDDAASVSWRDEPYYAIALDEGLLRTISGNLLPDQGITREDEQALIAKVRTLHSVGDGAYRCEIDYTDDVVQGEASLEYEGEQVVAMMDAVPDDLEVGRILMVEPGGEALLGAAIRVTSIEGNVVTGQQVEDLDEVLENAVISSDEMLPSEGALFFPEEDVEVTDSGGQANDGTMTTQESSGEISNDKASFKFKDDGSIQVKFKIIEDENEDENGHGTTTTSGEVDIVGTIKPKMTPDIDLDAGKFNVCLSTDFEFSVMGKVERDVHKRLGYTILPLHGGFSVLVELNFHFNVDGSIAVTFETTDVATLKLGKHCSFSNKLKGTNVEFSAEASIKAGPELDFTIMFTKKELYDVGVEAGVAGSGAAKRRPSGMVCIDLDAWFYAEIFAGRNCTDIVDIIRKVYPNMPTCKWEWEIVGPDDTFATLVKTPWKKHYHLEDLVLVPECTWEQSGGSGGSDDPDPGDAPDVDGVSVKDALNDYTWAELKKLANAIAAADSDASGLAIAKKYHLANAKGKLEGDEKAITLSDGTEAYVNILGFRHDDLPSGGKSGISFEFSNVPTWHVMNPEDPDPDIISTNEGGWEASDMRSWLNSDFYALLPSDLAGQIVEVSKLTNNVGQLYVYDAPLGDDNENDTSCISGTDDKLWLLSVVEVYGEMSGNMGDFDEPIWSPMTYDAEGSQYQLYRDDGVFIGYDDDERTMTSKMSVSRRASTHEPMWTSWWLRSPCADHSAGNFWHINKSGYTYTWHSHYELGVSPGFCL